MDPQQFGIGSQRLPSNLWVQCTVECFHQESVKPGEKSVYVDVFNVDLRLLLGCVGVDATDPVEVKDESLVVIGRNELDEILGKEVLAEADLIVIQRELLKSCCGGTLKAVVTRKEDLLWMRLALSQK